MYNAIIFVDIAAPFSSQSTLNVNSDLESLSPEVRDKVYASMNQNVLIDVVLPLGAYKVAHALRKNGYKTLVVGHMGRYSLDEMKELLDNAVTSDTKVIGFSYGFSNIYSAEYPLFPQGKSFENEIIDFLKTKNANLKILAGGSAIWYDYPNKNADYAFIGYSETSIVQLLNYLTYGSELPNSSRNIHGITIIDDRLAPDYDFVKDQMIWEETDILNYKVLPIEIGRGCIFKCKFCSYPLNGKDKLDFVKETDVLYTELLDTYNKFGITHYAIVDDTFNDSVEKLESVRQSVKKLPFQPVFWAYIRLDLVCTRPQTLDILYDMGIRAMFFGIETLDEKTGRIIGKGYNREKQIAMIKYIKDTYPDISLHGSFIAGLPEESIDSINNTIEQLQNGTICLDSWRFSPFYICPHERSFPSDIDTNYEKYGYKIDPNNTLTLVGNAIPWISDKTSYREVVQIVGTALGMYFRNITNKLTGGLALNAINLGYDFEFMTKTPVKDLPLPRIYEQIEEFIISNKRDLLNLVRKK